MDDALEGPVVARRVWLGSSLMASSYYSPERLEPAREPGEDIP